MSNDNMNEHNNNVHEESVAENTVNPQEGAEETANTAEQTPVEENASDKNWEAECKAIEDKYLRLYADFENYKRRTGAERIELFKTAGQEILLALIPVLDDFERAAKATQTATDVAQVKEGMELVHHKLKNILAGKGLKPMESIGEVFNPDLHEAITNIPAPSDDMKDKVIDEVERGYYLGDKVIRFAKVVVGS